MIYISPSLLSADLARLADAVEMVAGEADYIHCDVMDGHFVPNLTFGAPVVAALKRVSALPLDVHLMIDEPARWVEEYLRAGLDGRDFLIFHVEAGGGAEALVKVIRRAGVRPGIAIKPGTPIETHLKLAKTVDQVLLMTVEPGFGGQGFLGDRMLVMGESDRPGGQRAIGDILSKIYTVRSRCGDDLVVAVDGGIDPLTAPLAVRAGANLLVAGSSVFGKPDPVRAIRDLRATANAALLPATVLKVISNADDDKSSGRAGL